jgi:hypothetical protein
MDLPCPPVLLGWALMDGSVGHPEGGARFPSYIRLVWSNPTPPAPRRKMTLDVAIERHLTGADGLTDDQFVTLFAKG